MLFCSDPLIYRQKIKGYTKGPTDKQDRFKDLGSRDYKSLQTASTSEYCTFKPFLYKNSYRNRVHSKIKESLINAMKQVPDSVGAPMTIEDRIRLRNVYASQNKSEIVPTR